MSPDQQGRPAGWRPRRELWDSLKGHLLAEFTLALGRLSFVLLPSPSDWMRATHITKCNVLYSKSTNLNINLIQNTLMEISRIMFDQMPGHCGPSKLTHKN